MPNKTFREKTEELKNQMNAQLAALNALGDGLPQKVQEIKQSISTVVAKLTIAENTLNSRAVTGDHGESATQFETAKNNLMTALHEYYLSRSQKPKGMDKKIFNILDGLTTAIATSDGVLEQYQTALKTSANIISFNNDPEAQGDETERYFNTYVKGRESGIRPTIDECVVLSVSKNNPHDVFMRMLWLTNYGLRHNHPDYETDFYSNTLIRLINEIDSAPVGTRMQYLEIFNKYHHAIKDFGYPNDAFTNLCSRFGRGAMGMMMNKYNSKLRDWNQNGFAVNKMAETEHEAALNTMSFHYEKLVNDTREASSTFTLMQDAMKDLMKFDHNEITDPVAYSKALTKARDAVDIYIGCHRANPSGTKGQERIAVARGLKQSLSVMQKTADAKLSELIDTETRNASDEYDNGNISLAERNMRIGKMMRHITPVRMIPKNPDYKAEPSRLSKFGRALGHYVYSGINMLVGNTVGRTISNIARPFTQRNKKRPQHDLDTNLIPGGNGEKFKEYNPDDFGDIQPILDDVRRTPMVWERPIPEDPDQAPTVSFNFSQGTEGDERSYVGNGLTGHASVTLNYTKKNPFTGKDQRYSITVGFFPKGGFNTTNIMLAQYLNGMKIPATLGDDADNIYALSKTFEVTNKQINKILLAAQNYEKDGYNSITRNCTTFAADMAGAAGIDVSSIFKETDFTADHSLESLKIKMGLATGGALLGPQFTRLAKRDVLSKVGKKDLTYKNAGQEMLNAQDVKRLWSLDFNTRMKGYSPNYSAELIRHEKGTQIHSRQYTGSRNKHFEEGHGMFLTAIMAVNDELQLFSDAIDRAYSKASDKDDIAAVKDKVMQFCNTMQEGMGDVVDSLENCLNMKNDNSAFYLESLKSADKLCKEYVDGLNEIYANTFRGDDKLNIPFSHMISLLEHMQADVRAEYAAFWERNTSVNATRDNRRKVQAFLSDSQTYEFQFKDDPLLGNRTKRIPMKPSKLVGLYKAFGSVNEGAKAIVLLNHPEDYNLTPSERLKLKLALDTSDDFAKAEESFFSGREFTKADYKLAFYDLPKVMKEVKCVRPDDGAHRIYQSEIFNRMFGGMKPEVMKIISEAASKTNVGGYGKQICEKLTDMISDKLQTREGKHILAEIKEAMMPLITEKNPKHPDMNDEEYAKTLDNEFKRSFKTALGVHYVDALVADTLNAAKNGKLLNGKQAKTMYDEFDKVLFGSNLRSIDAFIIDEKLPVEEVAQKVDEIEPEVINAK